MQSPRLQSFGSLGNDSKRFSSASSAVNFFAADLNSSLLLLQFPAQNLADRGFGQ